MALMRFSPDIEALVGGAGRRVPDYLLGPRPPAGQGAALPAQDPVNPAAGDDIVRVVRVPGGEQAMGAFEAADRFDQTTALWCSPLQSADADILPDKSLLDGRTRDMLRNDALVQGGANLHKDNIVGAQFLLNATPATKVLLGKADDVWEEEFQEEVEEKFDLYAESPDNWIDASRTNNFTALVRMAVGIHLAAGEVLATVEWDRESAGEFKTAIQMIDLDRLSTDPRSANDKSVRAGIRFDRRNAPLAYQIQTQHPHDITWDYRMPEWKEVPVRKPWGRLQVIHLHEQIRPDQTRGVTEMAAALKEMRIGHRLRDITLQRHAAQALFAASITSEMPSELVFQQLGGGQLSSEQVSKMITAYAQGYLGSIDQYAGSAKNLQVDGVRIPHLYPGTKLELQSPGKEGNLGSEFEQSLLRYIAAALGVSYEQLSRDYTNTNYSSARAAMTETWKFMQSRKKILADRFASNLFRLWLEEAINNNRITTFPKSKAGLLYTNGRLNLAFDAITRSNWIGASRGQIDELKETQAAIARIEAGISTREDELARLGKDFRKVFRQLAREERLRASLKLVFTGGRNSVVAGVSSNDGEERKAA